MKKLISLCLLAITLMLIGIPEALADDSEAQAFHKPIRIELVPTGADGEPLIMIENASFQQSEAVQYSQAEAVLLAKIIYGESNSESMNGKIAVGTVIMNRVKSSKFPNSISGVIYQRGQFSGSKRQYNSSCMEAALRVLNGERNLPENVLYFKSTRLSRRWGSRSYHSTIGRHYFYT